MSDVCQYIEHMVGLQVRREGDSNADSCEPPFFSVRALLDLDDIPY